MSSCWASQVTVRPCWRSSVRISLPISTIISMSVSQRPSQMPICLLYIKKGVNHLTRIHGKPGRNPPQLGFDSHLAVWTSIELETELAVPSLRQHTAYSKRLRENSFQAFFLNASNSLMLLMSLCINVFECLLSAKTFLSQHLNWHCKGKFSNNHTFIM